MKRANWTEYQKAIADDKYYYARSCIRQNFYPGSEKAFLEILHKDLGRDIFDDPLHTSCTGIGYHSDIVPLETIMTVVARQFSLMNDAGYENFVTSCITSFGIYTEILSTWEEFPETEEKTRENLFKATGREFVKPKNLAHTSDVMFHFRNEIAGRMKRPLINARTGEPLRVVEHIGCHYAKIFPQLSRTGQPRILHSQLPQETREHGSLQAGLHRLQLPGMHDVPRQVAIHHSRNGRNDIR